MMKRGSFTTLVNDDPNIILVDYGDQRVEVTRDEFKKMVDYLNEHEGKHIFYETLVLKFGVIAMTTLPILQMLEHIEYDKYPVLNNAVAEALEEFALKEYADGIAQRD